MRWIAADWFKTFAISLILIWHLMVWWYSPLDKGLLELTPQFIVNLVVYGVSWASYSAIALPLIAGISFMYSTNKYSNKFIFKRAIILIILGYIVNFFTWGIYNFRDTFAWDAFQIIGLSLIIGLCGFKKTHWILDVIVAIIIIGLTDFFRQSFIDPHNYLSIIILGDPQGNNFYPLFPWLSNFFIGTTIFKLKNLYPKKFKYILLTFSISSYLILAFVFDTPFFVVDPNDVWGRNMFMSTGLEFTSSVLRALMLLAIFDFIPFSCKFIKYYSRGILFIFCFHLIVYYNIIRHLAPFTNYNVYILFIVILSSFITSYYIAKHYKFLKKRLFG